MQRLKVMCACVLTLTALSIVGCSKPISGLGGGGSGEVAVTIVSSSATAGDGGSSAATVAFGSLKGSIVVVGPPPVLAMPGVQPPPTDVKVCIVGTIKDRFDDRVQVGPGGEMANIFFYLPKKPKGGNKLPSKKERAQLTMDNVSCMFEPHNLLVMTGQEIAIHNSDAVNHNVQTMPKLGASYNSAINPGDKSGKSHFSYRVPETEPVKVKCGFHGWMEAWHLPLDHQYAVLTDKTGAIDIPDLPVGEHTFVMYFEGKKIGEKTVSITADQVTPIKIELKAADFTTAFARPAANKQIILSNIP